MSPAVAIREKHDGELADRSSVRLWLRLLSCTMVIEKDVQRRLSDRFGTTLPRFDLLAALDRQPEGLTMSALSRALLVSNGNVTQLVQKLAAEGLVATTPSPTDGRSSIVRLTHKGQQHFMELAEAHHGWIDALFASLDAAERDALYAGLGHLKTAIGKGKAA